MSIIDWVNLWCKIPVGEASDSGDHSYSNAVKICAVETKIESHNND
jgi:hypothetical protein